MLADGKGAVAQPPAVPLGLDDLDRRAGQEVPHGHAQDGRHLARVWRQHGHPLCQRDDRDQQEAGDANVDDLQPPDDPDARGLSIEADLLLRFAQGGPIGKVVAGVGGTAGEADLAGMTKVAFRP